MTESPAVAEAVEQAHLYFANVTIERNRSCRCQAYCGIEDQGSAIGNGPRR